MRASGAEEMTRDYPRFEMRASGAEFNSAQRDAPSPLVSVCRASRAEPLHHLNVPPQRRHAYQ